MIRSQIPLSLSAATKNVEAHSEGGRPAVVNGRAVRVHLGGGGVQEWIKEARSELQLVLYGICAGFSPTHSRCRKFDL